MHGSCLKFGVSEETMAPNVQILLDKAWKPTYSVSDVTLFDPGRRIVSADPKNRGERCEMKP